MIRRLVDSIRGFQEFVLEIGLARSVLALPAPRMLAVSTSTEDTAGNNAFAITITEPEIEEVARDLFASGHYSLAVQEAYKALDKYVGNRTGEQILSGTPLMEKIFSPNSPILYWTARQRQSEQDEQKGYHRLFSGAMLGIRNPVSHEFGWVEDQEVALELLVFAQHLMRKAKAAQQVGPVSGQGPALQDGT
jgi:uncharacterized protein (TIGR02391 family)